MMSKKDEFILEFKKASLTESISEKALLQASEAAYGEKRAYVLDFYRGIEDVIKFIENEYDNQLESLHHIQDIKSVTQKIRGLLIARIKKDSIDYEFRKELMEYYNTPKASIDLIKNTWKTCDEIWHLAGDNSMDFNYYTKRTILSCISISARKFYARTEDSDFSKTTCFIEKHLDRIKIFSKLKQSLKPQNIPFVRLFR